MAKRSITDEEISLIKAMLVRGMKNKDIQFFFNRPDRSVNSGRITGIAQGIYSNSSKIDAADNVTLDNFMSEFEPIKTTPLQELPLISRSASELPLAGYVTSRFFEKSPDGVWYFSQGEGEQHECKKNFGFKHSGRWLRAVAALANNKGGYILFGITENEKAIEPTTRFVVSGMTNDEFMNADASAFTRQLKSAFEPTPSIEARTIQLDQMNVGIIHVKRHESRPVIATKTIGDVAEGDIYFRYSGQSAKIKYGDLRAMLDERDRQARTQVLPMIEKLFQIGPDNSVVADLENGELLDNGRAILMDDDLIKKIKFIKEGEFNEKDGAPTLNVVGDVSGVATKSENVIHREMVEPDHLLDDFLGQKTPKEPVEYIKCAIKLGNGAWLPIHYYAKIAKLNQEEFLNIIADSGANKSYIRKYQARVTGNASAQYITSGEPFRIHKDLALGALPTPINSKSSADIARAFSNLECKPPSELYDLLRLIRVCKEHVWNNDRKQYGGAIRKGIARLDELYFAEWDKHN